MAKDQKNLQGFQNPYPQIISVVEDEEMEIGSPTDVKHVAHIGWDGPSVNGPTWMKEFSNVPEFQSSLRAAADLPGLNLAGDRPSIRLGIENLMGSKSNSNKLMDHATGELASSMTKKLKWKKIKSMSSKSSSSSSTGKSKTDIQSIAVAA